ncbi:MAG: sporulation integral membrane protein YtvI [Oscillospiraceae bacterium]|nr:sporulation integral membrane protein YtvI [Oscillospiraceae bacterium]
MTHNIPRKLLVTAAVILVLWFSLRFLLPVFLPFLFAALLALAAEPLVRVLVRRCRMPRWLAAGLGVCIALVLVILSALMLGALLLKELGSLAGVVPDLEKTARQGVGSLQSWLTELSARTPEGVRPILNHCVDGIFSGSSQFLDRISLWLLGIASGILRALPDSALGIGTWIIASFMISAKLPNLKQRAAALIPESWKAHYLPVLKQLKTSLGGWLLAQLKLTGITACILCIGFLILQIPYGILWGIGISLVDALPILGTGMVLVPWSVVCFLQGDTLRAIGLLGIYIVAVLVRSVMEPKLVGKQLGLDPLITLVALYAGYRLWGLGGMILAPLLAVTVTQLLQAKPTQ